MDFYKIAERSTTRGKEKTVVSIDIYPDFVVKRSNDLMIRAKSFYAIWDEKTGMWSQDEYKVAELIDEDLYSYKDILTKNTRTQDATINVLSMKSYKSSMWKNYKQYTTSLADNYHELDARLTFLNTDVKKEDYVSKRLGYALEKGDYSAWDKLIGTLYDPEERKKVEWAIGAVISGDSKTIQKFCVFYGDPGTGKSTVIRVLEKLFDGYSETIDAKGLGSFSNQFSTEVFKKNPLVAIQDEAKLSRIEDNTKLNSIVSHEPLVINEKGKPQYTLRPRTFIFLGTNDPVKITDGRSGIIRRLIDIHPSGRLIKDPDEYFRVVDQIDFELGAIAYHCLQVYKKLGKNYYNTYIPRDMIMKTDVFYNFVDANLDIFEAQDGMTLKQAYTLYKEYCDDALVEFKLPRHKFREEMKVYYESFEDLAKVDGKFIRSWYSGFKRSKMESPNLVAKVDQGPKPTGLIFDCDASLLDEVLADCPAQYATEDEREKPVVSWDACKTTLKDIDTSRVHYILPRFPDDPRGEIVCIDFDLKNEKGEKDQLLNLEAASKWPATYGEFSKGGGGIHLYYWYKGDVYKLSSVHSPGIEIKPPVGKLPIRRRLSKCNDIPIATLNVGALPMKEEKMIDIHELQDVKHLVNKIKKSLRKEDNVGGTKCEVEFIKKTLDDAYASGMHYDVSDMEHDILTFGMGSTNNSQYCVDLVYQMKFKSKDVEQEEERKQKGGKKNWDDMPITFFDIEIYPPGIDSDGEENEGLFLICWKDEGEGQPVHDMVNPKPHEVEMLFEKKLEGYNNLKYDNPMIYFAAMGYSNAKLYDLSHRIIVEKARDAIPYAAKQLSYTDCLDYAATKKSLKEWEIELDADHIEMDIPWDKPAPKRLWPKIIEYCKNDVKALELVHNHLHGDFLAREMIAKLAKGTVNETTNNLTNKFVFEGERHPELTYTHLDTGEQEGEPTPFEVINAFPGYEYKWSEAEGKYINYFRGVDLGRGGYSYSEPGIYSNVVLIDVKSMHPHSIIAMNYFGKYTKRYADIIDMRIAIKEGRLDDARKMFNGELAEYLDDPSTADALAQALKILGNSAYGQTSASYDNPMRDSRNVNNIVALRGALFMKTLLDELQSRGWTVCHLKVDSMKIPNATPEVIQFCQDFAKKYGYEFDHEAVYERMCLIDKAQYVASYLSPEECEKRFGYVPSANKKHFKKHNHPWTTTGDAFQHPYIFKTLFSGEEVGFKDRCETKRVKDAAIYLDLNEDLPDVSDAEKELDKRIGGAKKLSEKYLAFSNDDLENYISGGHNYTFVGRCGSFYPVRPGVGGGVMYALRNEKYGSVNGTKGYRWLESNIVKSKHMEDDYDPLYFDNLIDGAIKAVNNLNKIPDPTRFSRFIDLSKPYEEQPSSTTIDPSPPTPVKDPFTPPWIVPCGDEQYRTCAECPDCTGDACKKGYSLCAYIGDGAMEDDELPF